jgi:hypothetical protein
MATKYVSVLAARGISVIVIIMILPVLVVVVVVLVGLVYVTYTSEETSIVDLSLCKTWC